MRLVNHPLTPAKEPGTDSAAAGLDTAVGNAANTADAELDSANNLAVAVNAAVDNLQALRRLFYSIVEHLRETADRQAELNDETERARTPANTPLEQRLGPLVDRQSELARIAEGIASALQSQASQMPESAGGQNDDQPLTPRSTETRRRSFAAVGASGPAGWQGNRRHAICGRGNESAAIRSGFGPKSPGPGAGKTGRSDRLAGAPSTKATTAEQ